MSSQKSRVGRLAERFGESSAEDLVTHMDRRYWALYRTEDLSQSEVMEQVKAFVDTSQPTVSRAISKADRRALVEEDFIQLGGEYESEDLADSGKPEEWFEAYKDVLAGAVRDRMALEIIADEHRFTPEWAAKRFPELVGCNEHVARRWGWDDKEICHDDHLNHLESVNTDKWRDD